MSFTEKISVYIKQKAKEAGFDFCGFSKAKKLTEEEQKLHQWLDKGMHAGMGYMENHFDKRLDPSLLVPGAKSVISLLYNYYPENELKFDDGHKISKYAYGKDYHDVLKKKLRKLLESVSEKAGGIAGRVFVDSAPVMERQWAARSGLGWIGKNTLLINKQKGSYFFLAEIITDLALTYDSPVKDYCGSCTKCIDACPTQALVAPGTLDAGKCISYFTIELKDEIPEAFTNTWKDWIFGCDICQDVCPWNRFSEPHHEKDFLPSDDLKQISSWQEITEEVFKKTFKGSPLKRPGYQRILRNIRFLDFES